jgi:hypothetical protein
MHKLTQNFECWISKDGHHFTVHNTASNTADGGYKLGEYAEFEDNGMKYKVTITDLDKVDLLKVD